MTATATIDEAQELVARPLGRTMFLARRDNLRLVKRPRRPIRGDGGEKVGDTEGETIQFVPYHDPVKLGENGKPLRYGRFDCPSEGTVLLEDGREADAAEVHAWLLKHRLIGNPHEGFFKVDPTAPAPTRAELDRLMEAAWDEELLVEIIRQERAGWAREDILSVAEGGLVRLRQVKAQAEANARQEAAAAAQTPAAPAPKTKGAAK